MPNKPLSILLAEDDEDDRFFFKEAIDQVKIKTDLKMVTDGVELMDYLLNPENPRPHVVFLDLNMPRKGGIECLEEIRANKDFNDLTIAIYSTSASDNDIEETFVKGANVYIRKPSDFKILQKIIAEVLSINWQYHTSGLNKDHFLLSI
ncbi:MAG TPA: response regulator [Lentimicrobium sp.]|nr:response regulator [Lentimicrobium sp.]